MAASLPGPCLLIAEGQNALDIHISLALHTYRGASDNRLLTISKAVLRYFSIISPWQSRIRIVTKHVSVISQGCCDPWADEPSHDTEALCRQESWI